MPETKWDTEGLKNRPSNNLQKYMESPVSVCVCVWKHTSSYNLLSMETPSSDSSAHLVNINGNPNDDVQQVSQGQAGDQDVGPVAHAFILIDDPQQSRISDDADDKHQARDHCVDVLKCVSDFRGSSAHRRHSAAWHCDVGSHRTLNVPLNKPQSLGDSESLWGALTLWLQLPTGCKETSPQKK